LDVIKFFLQKYDYRSVAYLCKLLISSQQITAQGYIKIVDHIEEYFRCSGVSQQDSSSYYQYYGEIKKYLFLSPESKNIIHMRVTVQAENALGTSCSAFESFEKTLGQFLVEEKFFELFKIVGLVRENPFHVDTLIVVRPTQKSPSTTLFAILGLLFASGAAYPGFRQIATDIFDLDKLQKLESHRQEKNLADKVACSKIVFRTGDNNIIDISELKALALENIQTLENDE